LTNPGKDNPPDDPAVGDEKEVFDSRAILSRQEIARENTRTRVPLASWLRLLGIDFWCHLQGSDLPEGGIDPCRNACQMCDVPAQSAWTFRRCLLDILYSRQAAGNHASMA
jgi:hypothetical protein